MEYTFEIFILVKWFIFCAVYGWLLGWLLAKQKYEDPVIETFI